MTLSQSQAIATVKAFYKKFLPSYVAKASSWEADIEQGFSIGSRYGESLKATFDNEIATAIVLAGSTEQAYLSKPSVIGIDPVAYVNQLVPTEIINYLYPGISVSDKSAVLSAIGSGSLSITDFGSAMSILTQTNPAPTVAEIIKAPVQLTATANLPDSPLNFPGLSDGQLGFLTSMYIGAFGRTPDHGGLKYWANELATDISTGETQHGAYLAVGRNIYQAGTENGEAGTTLNNADYITFAYTNALGRNPDSGGYSYWLNDLNSGSIGRSDFLTTFLTAGLDSERDSNFLYSRIAVGEFAALEQVSGTGAPGIDSKAILNGVTDVASATNTINGIIAQYGTPIASIAQIGLISETAIAVL
ncbi:DUF4214 domain-containing protein [Pseudomonas sp. 21LCFQ02]|uniref:DUF4214 domain-containing protein n=1 Tax=Pseudomonas sp. 21LCFQ02 TaxID=2957505 RepID=UPI00209A9DE5|nr:DUF4214 domain-containing protein [Pseudomonas sp. 21LCFQ02]MCO8166181.1 DUF4214 domain-containing protein [Pseudomonas sp. 21LCFQ02]